MQQCQNQFPGSRRHNLLPAAHLSVRAALAHRQPMWLTLAIRVQTS